ncbi:unnamed protein product [Toxocara canis]|uniref:GPI inositol-deacylase n=1 Tax=Toxocara canis TaxID=6265 RepID=A0A183TXG2_TOXCA|nr:unnamed protein product [Toxocara canis]
MRKLQALVSALICAFGMTIVVFVLRYRPTINKCNMTYMYRFMHFMPIEISVNSSTIGDNDAAKFYSFSSSFQSYSTILYGEGVYANNFLSTGRVSGIPVIFVPGNGGSSRQVRSLGSLLHNKTESRKSPFTFDVFAVDFNEELTGIAGMYLERQIRYVEAVVEHIWNLYSPPPQGIVFVAHSMGGVVVRSLLRNPYFDASRIALIVTLATPHSAPPEPLDDFLANAYVQMKDVWEKRKEELSHVRVVSISGGLRDVLVPDDLTDDAAVIHFSTSSIDGVELDADHLCIVWCNQLVRITSRLLFEYASSPKKFASGADRIIHRLFSSNGRVRENKTTGVGAIADGVTIMVNRIPSVVRNSASLPLKYSLSVSVGDWVFLTLAAFSSYLLVNEQPYEGMHTLGKHEYCLLPANIASQSSVVLYPREAIRAVAVFENTLTKTAVSVNSVSLFASLLLPLWESGINGTSVAVVLPVKFERVVIAVEAELKEISCNGKAKGVSRVEFGSGGSRRVSDRNGPYDSVVGFSSDGIEKDELVLFILDSQCQYDASLRTNYAYTLQLLIRKNLFTAVFHITAYLMCAWIASTILNNVKGEEGNELNNCKCKLQLLSTPQTLSHKDLRPGSSLCTVNGEGGASSELLKTTSTKSVLELRKDSPLVLLTVAHLLALLCFGPFCACSVWNVLKYGVESLSVYEDPARFPSYLLCIALFLRSVFSRQCFSWLVSNRVQLLKARTLLPS